MTTTVIEIESKLQMSGFTLFFPKKLHLYCKFKTCDFHRNRPTT